MADSLVIVESPAKAKTIKKFLGKNFTVLASNGHVRDLPKSQFGVDVNNDFAPKYITLRGKGEVLEHIRKEAKTAKKIYLATDPDREGEAISWHLAHILGLDPASKNRIVFHEITANAVKNALKNVRKIDMNLVDAQQTRRILDRMVGYMISPILWAKVRKGLSAGRVQSVATRLICDREDEINAFDPEEYWVIAAQLPAGEKRKPFEAKFYGRDGKKLEVGDKALADEILAQVGDSPFTVTKIKVTERKKHPAPPFTTSNLQQEAARKLGFTTKRTMMVAQQLYEGISVGTKGATGLVTYIRTDSVRVSNEALDSARAHIAETFGAKYLPEKPNFYKGRRGAQDAHEAIRPTDVSLVPKSIKEFLTGDQFKLYKLIYDRFLASQMVDALQQVNVVTLDANGCAFRANGVRTLFDGFTAVYTEGRDDEQESEIALPPMQEGDVFCALAVTADQRFTQPPPRYTEATLVKALEENGIGRPSTYATTISTVLDRGYVQREKKQLLPTELGVVVTELMKQNFQNIVDVQFTADMEDKLDGVEEGQAKWAALLGEFYGPFEQTVEVAKKTIEKVKIEDEVSDIPCEKCGEMMVYKFGRFGKFLACPGYPACRNTKAIVEKIGVPCPKCGAEILKKKSKRGKAFYGCEAYPNCDFVSWDKPVAQKCPDCGGQLVQKIGPHGSFIRCTAEGCGHILRAAKKAEKSE
ncbi:MAG: type I DNA topoisomerase [Clostridiales bacterium]|nr:type I DNA topoisomerase [Clostridiales bacterium]